MTKKNRFMKHQEAQQRSEAWSKLTPQQQLAILDKRLGKGVGATKQREAIAKAIKERRRA